MTQWPWPLTYNLENNNISWRSISPISKPYFVKKSSNCEFLCLNAHKCTLECKDVQVHSFGHNSRKTQWTGIWYSCVHLHIRILQYTKFHKHLIKHVGGVVMTKCWVNCIKFPSPNRHNSGKTQWTRIYNVLLMCTATSSY